VSSGRDWWPRSIGNLLGYVLFMLRVRVGFALVGAGILVSLVGAAMLVENRFVELGISLSAGVLLIFGGAMLIALTGTREERKQRQTRTDRWGAALGMARARASGGWTPRQRERKPPQHRNRAE
jgi:hypothetical protein